MARAAVEGYAHESRTTLTRASGQPAVAYYHFDDEQGQFKAAALDVLSLEGSRIKEITGFVMPEIFPRFGLPLELAS